MVEAVLYVVLVLFLSLWRIEAIDVDTTLYVNITILESAVEKGAVCLDGSAPAYLFHRGTGSGELNWLVHLEGGGWCSSILDCLRNTNMSIGSSNYMDKFSPFYGALSNNSEMNPEFYNWNRVTFKYCDGSSFTGDIEEVDPATNLHFRGARIFKAIVEELLAEGMSNAQNAILSGSSAGGLAAMLNCDKFRNFLPNTARVKCISGAGFFINANTITDEQAIEEMFEGVVALHGSIKNLPSSCTSTLLRPSLCFFPEYAAKHILTPLFIVNSAYDSWQVNNTLVPYNSDPRGIWNSCKMNITQCSYTQLNILHEFRSKFLMALNGLGPSYTRGYFITSCHSHKSIDNPSYWFRVDSPVLNNKRMAIAVRDWFYDISGFQLIDCPYPCGQIFCHL